MSGAAPVSSLAEHDRLTVARAREVAALTRTDAMRERYGEADGDMARARALGEAQFLLGELAAIIGRLAGQSVLPVAPPEIRMLMTALTSLDYGSLTEAERAERAMLAYKLGTVRAAQIQAGVW